MVRSIAAPFLDEPDFSDVEDPGYYTDELVGDGVSEELEVISVQPGESVLSGQLNWNMEPRRDPFSRGDSEVLVERTATAVGSSGGLPIVPRLDALVAGPDSLLAVLDDRIVREGDVIAGFRVSRIDSDGVLLRAGNVSHRLRVADMSFGRVAEVSAIEDPALSLPVDNEHFPSGNSGF